jgi:hypothetical protein
MQVTPPNNSLNRSLENDFLDDVQQAIDRVREYPQESMSLRLMLMRAAAEGRRWAQGVAMTYEKDQTHELFAAAPPTLFGANLCPITEDQSRSSLAV